MKWRGRATREDPDGVVDRRAGTAQRDRPGGGPGPSAVLLAALAWGAARAERRGDPQAQEVQGDAMQALRAYLDRVRPGMRFDIDSVDVDLPGWSIFEGREEDVRDGGVLYWVVRADGTVVADEEAEGELGRIAAALGLPGAAVDAEDLARVVLALLGRGQEVVDGEVARRLGARLEPGELRAPTLDALEGGAALLVFDAVTTGRGPTLWRWRVEFRPGGEVEARRESRVPRRRGG